MSMTPLKAAPILLAAGLSVIPVKTDGSKASLIAWKDYQSRLMTDEEAEFLFRAPCGLATVAGAVSGNLEILDIEAAAPQAELVQLIDEHLPGLLPTLPQVQTPTGGRHAFYR